MKPTVQTASGDAPSASPDDTEARTVIVVGASGNLGGGIVEALLERGVRVRAMVRATSNRSRLEALGVTDFVVADLNDAASLRRAMTAGPRAAAVIASAAGFTAHSARTKADNSRTDIEGYRNLIDAAKDAGVPRFVLISILGCDRAPGTPHSHQKYAAEQYLIEKRQPHLSLRAGAFLDRGRDIVPESVRQGRFPDILPGVSMALIYSRDLARYAAQAALDVPASALNQSIDIGSETAATGADVAAAFTRVLGRPVTAKPVFPSLFFTLAPLLAPFLPRLRNNLAVLAWLRKGGYVSRDPQQQKLMFCDLPSVEETVARYCRAKALA